ncbi:MAG TPA: glycosyltransferase, partial [Thermomicrobiales bacterium]|nr:glycosyltransferase [Thermomicrobiales bacterium]
PFFKPDWAPDLLHSLDYVGSFAAARRDLTLALGGFRDDLPGAEQYDLTLRVADRLPTPEAHVVHLPRLLFSQFTPSPDAHGERDPAAEAAGRRAVAASLARQGIEADVEPGLIPGARRIRRALRERPPATLIVPTGGKMHYLRPCLDSLLNATTYPDIRLLVVDNSNGGEVAALCGELARNGARIRREPFPETPFNFSATINHALTLVETPYVVLLNDDMTVVTPDWIEAMLEHAQRAEIGAVGAKLLYPDDTLQHAGVIFGPYGGSTHPFRHVPPSHPGYFGFPHVVREWSAVTFACAMLRMATFAEIGLLDDVNFRVAFNDADFCLRLRERGYRIVYTPHAVLRHYESATKKLLAEPGEVEYMRRRWGHVIARDPYYNPNLTRTGEDYSLDMG